jgi:probable addiction module antidote protein
MPKIRAFDPAKYRGNPEKIAKYLSDALASDDPAFTARVIGKLARAHGMAAIAEQAHVSREGLYRSFNGKSDPAFGTVLRVLAALGVQLVATRRAAN